VLNEVSFELERGTFVTLLGPNGSGKSTLMKVCAGILPLKRGVDSGQIKLHGQNFLAYSPSARAQHVAYVAPDVHAEFPLSVHETVLLGRTCYGIGTLRRRSREDDEAVQWAMSKAFCWGLRDRDLHTLSGGERQLVAIARALAQGAKILFLDEALSRMDLNHQAAIGRMLKSLTREGYTVLLVAHDVNLATEWADQCILLNRGEILARGATAEVFNERNLKLLYPGERWMISKSPVSEMPKVYFGASDHQ